MWNLVLDDMLRIHLPENAEILAFADDTVMIVHGNSRLELERTLQVATERIVEWAATVKLTFTAEKSQGILLKGKLTRGRPPQIKIGNDKIRFKDSVVFLGVTIDSRMTFLPHVKAVGEKANALLHKVLRIVRLKYGVRPDAYKILSNTVYKPIIQYALSVWVHRVPNSLIRKALRVCQRSVLLGMTGAYRTVSFPAVTIIAGHPPPPWTWPYLKLMPNGRSKGN